jgi:hypothetical protein
VYISKSKKVTVSVKGLYSGLLQLRRGEADRDDIHVLMEFFGKDTSNGLFQKTYRQNEVSAS